MNAPQQTAPDAVALYARVSTEDQAERQTVLAQLDFLRRLCELHGHRIAGEYVDDGVSGTVPLDRREDRRRLLQDAEARRFRAVVVYRLDRLGRSLSSLLDAHDALAKHGVAIRSGSEPFDTGTSVGMFLFQLLGSLAQLERSTISERTAMGRNRIAGDGKYTGGPIPVGYDIDDQGAYMLSTRLVPHLDVTEAEMIRDIFRRLADGTTTIYAEFQRLNDLGVPRVTRYGGENAKASENARGWGFSMLRRMIHNPVYKGESVVISRFGGRVARPVPAIVDAETWQRAQESLLNNRRMSKKNAKRDYALRGLIRCQNCGRSYIGSAPDGGERKYRCGGGTCRPRCSGKMLPAD